VAEFAATLEDAPPDGRLWSGPKVARWIAAKSGRPSVHPAARLGVSAAARLSAADAATAAGKCGDTGTAGGVNFTAYHLPAAWPQRLDLGHVFRLRRGIGRCQDAPVEFRCHAPVVGRITTRPAVRIWRSTHRSHRHAARPTQMPATSRFFGARNRQPASRCPIRSSERTSHT
jgi:hypothetical protein